MSARPAAPSQQPNVQPLLGPMDDPRAHLHPRASQIPAPPPPPNQIAPPPPPAHQTAPPRFPEEVQLPIDSRRHRRYPRWHIPVMGDPPPPQHSSGPYHQLEHMEPFAPNPWHHGPHPPAHI